MKIHIGYSKILVNHRIKNQFSSIAQYYLFLINTIFAKEFLQISIWNIPYFLENTSQILAIFQYFGSNFYELPVFSSTESFRVKLSSLNQNFQIWLRPFWQDLHTCMPKLTALLKIFEKHYFVAFCSFFHVAKALELDNRIFFSYFSLI